MAARLLALHTGYTLLPREIFWYSFLSEDESIPGPQCSWKVKVSYVCKDLLRKPTEETSLERPRCR
jgi:hypothetical protein